MISNMKNIRLEKIADMVKKGVTAADIGTDHAFLPVLLINAHTCTKVYACDVAKGPLHAAEENIQRAGLSSSIPVILSDGLQNVPQDADACIIAGMGCMTAVQILEAAKDRIPQMKQIIVEVNRDTDKMREWISQQEYTIEDEIYVNDRGHDYVAVSFSAEHHAPYTKEELLLGPVLLKKREPAYVAYCERMIKKIDLIIKQSNGNAFQMSDLETDRSIYKKYIEN